jgi:hypothetical protein
MDYQGYGCWREGGGTGSWQDSASRWPYGYPSPLRFPRAGSPGENRRGGWKEQVQERTMVRLLRRNVKAFLVALRLKSSCLPKGPSSPFEIHLSRERGILEGPSDDLSPPFWTGRSRVRRPSPVPESDSRGAGRIAGQQYADPWKGGRHPAPVKVHHQVGGDHVRCRRHRQRYLRWRYCGF